MDLVGQLAAELLKFVIEQIDHMERIENDRGRWQVFRDGTDVGLGMSMATASMRARDRLGRRQKGCSASAPFPSPAKTPQPVSRSKTTVRYVLALADADFVDCDLAQVLELRS